MKTDFAMAIHFHQPVGNFDDVIESACNNCYMPFLDMLKDYPEIRMSLHFTGCLLEWFDEKKPEMIDRIRSMADTAQIELMGGGFYEPILPSIPERDRSKQIKLLKEYLKKKFKQDIKGAWIAERVWEPHLPSTLHDSGIDYVILDNTHFLYSGISKDDTYGFYATENNGKSVFVFPSDKTLRYMIPFRMPEECFDYMRGVMARVKTPLFVYGDDGEKFGEWPGTYKWVFEEKWLEKFFKSLKANKDWLNTLTLGESIEKYRSKGRVYLQTTSYDEMLEWALPVKTQIQMENVINDIRYLGKEDYYKPFIRGGFWRNFLSKYPESNDMNKKMIFVSGLLEEVRKTPEIPASAVSAAEKELFRGQCNCGYWHGIFGGLYLYHLRRAIYYHLINCEAILDEALHGGKDFCEKRVLDVDADGYDEIILRNKYMDLMIDPARGGVIRSIDFKSNGHNFVNVLSRKEEAYHRRIIEKLEHNGDGTGEEVKTIHEGGQRVSEGIDRHFIYDPYRRYCLIDHFLGVGTKLDDISGSDYREEGDFAECNYDHRLKKTKKGFIVRMSKKGSCAQKPILLTKDIYLDKDRCGFDAVYTIRNDHDEGMDLVFAPEFNIIMPFADSDMYSISLSDKGKRYMLKDPVDETGVTKVSISDHNNETKVELFSVDRFTFWMYPVKTVSQSEQAFELNYQGSSMIPVFNVNLLPGRSKEIKLTLSVLLG